MNKRIKLFLFTLPVAVEVLLHSLLTWRVNSGCSELPDDSPSGCVGNLALFLAYPLHFTLFTVSLAIFIVGFSAAIRSKGYASALNVSASLLVIALVAFCVLVLPEAISHLNFVLALGMVMLSATVATLLPEKQSIR